MYNSIIERIGNINVYKYILDFNAIIRFLSKKTLIYAPVVATIVNY